MCKKEWIHVVDSQKQKKSKLTGIKKTGVYRQFFRRISMKTALITGASSGLGTDFARLFARDGFNLVIVARRKEKLEALAEEIKQEYSVDVTILAADLSDPAAPAEIFKKVQEKGIFIDFLVNNAGTQVYGKFQENDLEQEIKMIRVNITSLTELTKLFVSPMIKKGAGRILNVGSTGSFAPGVYNAVYCASKAYVLSFSEALIEDLSGTGVWVTTLCPGATKTEFAAKHKLEDSFLFKNTAMKSEKVAKIGYKALMKKKAVKVAGFINWFQIFSVRFSPRWMVRKISKKLMS